MGIELSGEIVDSINDETSLKVLASLDPEGAPHVVFKASLRVDPDGRLRYFELIESSRSNRNLVHSLWFGRTVAIAVLGAGRRSFQIKGRPVRSVICGREFREHYVEMKERFQADLSAVWFIEPLEAREETFAFRRDEENRRHPLLRHLDFFTAEPASGTEV